MEAHRIDDLAWRVFAIAVMTSLPAIILAIATLLQVLRSSRQGDRLERGVNGRLDQLLAEARKAALLEGFAQGLRHQEKPQPAPPPTKDPPEDRPPGDTGLGIV